MTAINVKSQVFNKGERIDMKAMCLRVVKAGYRKQYHLSMPRVRQHARAPDDILNIPGSGEISSVFRHDMWKHEAIRASITDIV